MGRRLIGVAAAAVFTLTAAFAASGPATASATQGAATTRHTWSRTIADNVVMPFQLAVHDRTVYATDGMLGTVTKYPMRGGAQVLASTHGETAGIDVSASGRTYAYTGTDSGGSYLQVVGPGSASRRVDLGAYEKAHNPDGNVTYGIIAGGNPCAEQVLGGLTGGQATYEGIVDSHPYAVASLGDGAWAVADAAGNDILRVDARGHVSTIAVLPRQPITITAAQASAAGLPACVVGVTYAFEPVPTDVEYAMGSLWVSLLPGGPEDPSLGARGKVVRLGVCGGRVHEVASGFLGATNLVVAHDGTVYVAELFAGKITALRGHHRWTAYTADRTLSVEVSGHSLYIGIMGVVDESTGAVQAPGKIIQVRR